MVERKVKIKFYMKAWFHTLVNTRWYRITAAVICLYLCLYAFFACLYMVLSDPVVCFAEMYEPMMLFNGTRVPVTALRRFSRAAFFSIETMMTIGFGVDRWRSISDCPQMLLVIAVQAMVGVFTSSVVFGIVLTRVSSADSRAHTVAFSDTAVVRAGIDDELYLVLRVTEMRKHQLNQAYVHAYAMMDSADVIGDTAAESEGSSVHALPLSLVHPHGELLLVTPCFIVHRLDCHSPLLPPDAAAELLSAAENDPSRGPCDDLPTLLRALQAQPSASSPGNPSLRALMSRIKQHMIRTHAEVLIVLEGVDATTSSVSQARQSYTVDDIRWDATFVPCARRQPSGGIRIDFEKLHAVLPLGNLQPPSELMRIPTADLPLTASLNASLSLSPSAAASVRASISEPQETPEAKPRDDEQAAGGGGSAPAQSSTVVPIIGRRHVHAPSPHSPGLASPQ